MLPTIQSERTNLKVFFKEVSHQLLSLALHACSEHTPISVL